MHLYFRNVNDALQELSIGFQTDIFHCDMLIEYASPNRSGLQYIGFHPPMARTKSRYGEVIVIQEPVCITYQKPLERVLFNKHRDANPFFHLIEALWTLAGRDDIEPLMYFNSRVSGFSDDGKAWYGAYGKRWAEFHQLETAIEILKRDRTCRRVVIQQWEASDLTRVLDIPICKDVPCNTEVMFLPRHVNVGGIITEYLDMTVINRSNDLIWGCLGSNYVTFSMLLEYMALAAGYTPGFYHQVTNNLHVYVGPGPTDSTTDGKYPTEIWSQKFNPAHLVETPSTRVRDYTYSFLPQRTAHESLSEFDHDLQQLFSGSMLGASRLTYHTFFFRGVVVPMLLAWGHHKQRNYLAAHNAAFKIESSDWNQACIEWLARRKDTYLLKGNKDVATST